MASMVRRTLLRTLYSPWTSSFQWQSIRWATKKAAGSTKNSGGSAGRRLGLKKGDGWCTHMHTHTNTRTHTHARSTAGPLPTICVTQTSCIPRHEVGKGPCPHLGAHSAQVSTFSLARLLSDSVGLSSILAAMWVPDQLALHQLN